jgi:DNA-binding response OmpR family regulator
LGTAALQGRRVLVVEDESLVAMLVEDMLLDLGAEVEVAMRMAEGLRLAREGEFGLAVLDVNLGGGQRSDAIADALSERGIPFLFATGYGERGLAERHRGTTTIQKPYHVRELDRAIAQVLAR